LAPDVVCIGSFLSNRRGTADLRAASCATTARPPSDREVQRSEPAMKTTSLFGCLAVTMLLGACSADAGDDPEPRAKKPGTSSKNVDGGRTSGGNAGGDDGDEPTSGTPGGSSAGTPGGGTPGGSTTPDGGASTGDGGFLLGPNVAITPAAGANTADLSVANATFAGAKLTFDAVLTPAAGTGKGSVAISNIVVDNASNSGMRMVRPVWIVEDAAGKSLAFVSQTTIDLTVPAKRKSPYAALGITIDAYAPGTKLRIVFGAIATSTATAITGLPATTYTECKSPTTFAPGVTQHWGVQACRNCHAGLFSYDFFGKDDATACGLNKRLLAAGGPNLLRPTQAAHAGGVMANAAGYQTALNAWRAAEQ
jgi:hypothetical protein